MAKDKKPKGGFIKADPIINAGNKNAMSPGSIMSSFMNSVGGSKGMTGYLTRLHKTHPEIYLKLLERSVNTLTPKPIKKYHRHLLPNEYQTELLLILIEEAAEVQHRALKLLRFGAAEIQKGQRLTNAQRLSQECGDLYAMVARLEDEGMILGGELAKAIKAKRAKLKKYMRHKPEKK